MNGRLSRTPAGEPSSRATLYRPKLLDARTGTMITCLLFVVLSSGCGWKSWDYNDGVYKVNGYCDPKRAYPPRASDHEIVVFSERPREAHEVVARIWASWTPESGNQEVADVLFAEGLKAATGVDIRPKYGSAGTALAGIKAQARSVGADAIVTVRGTFTSPVCDYYPPDDSGGRNTGKCELRAVVVEAIRFQADVPGENDAGGPEETPDRAGVPIGS